MTSRQPANTHRLPIPLVLILLIFSAVTVTNSILLPLGEADDETDHYHYLRFVARTGHPPFTEAERDEAGFKGGLAPLYYWLVAWPIALAGADAAPDIRRVDARPERHIPTDGLGINHVLHTLDEQWPWQGQVLAWHLIRLLSLPMGWVTITAGYALARRLLPGRKAVATGAAAFIAFLPRFVGSSAVINDDNLVFALTALLLLVQVAILQGSRRSRTFALLGALFGLALVTKYFSLILGPEIIFTLAVYFVGRKKAGKKAAPRQALRPLAAFAAALALVAGPWFVFITLRFNRVSELGLVPGLAASLGEPQITEGLAGLLSGRSVRPPAATYLPVEWLGLLYRSFWFEYGWMQIFAAGWVYILFSLFLLAALAGFIKFGRSRLNRLSSPIPWLLAMHLALFIGVVLGRYILSATIDTGQGRHLFPALPVIALVVALGINELPLLPRLFKTGQSGAGNRLQTQWLRFLLPAAFYLLPSLVSLWPGSYILPHYDTLPVTITPPAGLPVAYRQSLPLEEGLLLAGLDVPAQATAGQALPVTLYWQAKTEATQEYLLSLCLLNSQERPAACWRGHLAGGRYPARAWEPGDTIINAVFIPIPTCYRLQNQSYRLRLEVWPLESGSPEAVPAANPVLAHTFAGPAVTIRAADGLLTNLPQTVDVWQAGNRLDGPVSIRPGQAITWLTYAAHSGQSPAFEAGGPEAVWLPLSRFNTPLYLPCAGGPSPFAYLSHFIAGPTLPPGSYRPTAAAAPPNLALLLRPRARTFAPAEAGPTFAQMLAPLSLQLAGEPAVSLTAPAGSPPSPPYALPATAPTLPVTIRWQARQWMADPLVASLKLLDKDFAVAAERVAVLGNRYPNVLWAPTEIVEETYPLALKPNAPPGLYRLELSVIHQNSALPEGFEYLPLTGVAPETGHNLYPVTVRLLDPAHNTPPPVQLNAQLGRSIRLTGYGLNSLTLRPGEPVLLALYWQAGAPVSTGYTVFTQLIGPDGQVWAQWDNPPQAGRYPTTAWTPNDTVVDRYTLTPKAGAPPGNYRLLAGMYNPATGQRLPVMLNGQPQPGQAVELAVLSLGP